MRRDTFNNYLKRRNFEELFIYELGWNQIHGQTQLPAIEVNGDTYSIKTIATRNGFNILSCETDFIPTLSVCKKLDLKLRKMAFNYICIFHQRGCEHQMWVSPVLKLGKRNLVAIEYDAISQTDFLFSKIGGITFGLEEVTTISDVKQRVQAAFAINSEKITKDFYKGFRKVLTNFATHITGIEDSDTTSVKRRKLCYASTMLNRIMFCYFIQKKGFLDGNVNYLPDKLKWVRFEKGLNRFYDSFYKGFLRSLFYDGLNSGTRNTEFTALYGKIPYINGGLFASNQLELAYPDLDINDDAFIELFDFLDTWKWHLDTRLSSSGKDINPDVLGYIFEQYINDRAEMGAFYTQEDITEFISKNSIIPALFNPILTEDDAFRPGGYANALLKEDPVKYIYDSVKYGYTTEWKQCIPADIAIGIDKSTGNLTGRRLRWNEKADAQFGCIKESWRDVITRFERCDTFISAVENDEIKDTKDLITYNIDIRLFAQDLIGKSNNADFVNRIYKALNTIKIADIACGSGAFLFAALNVLEPLYEECIHSMICLRKDTPSLFSEELDNAFHNPYNNLHYWICTQIVLNNIYGADIMPEAIEIAKLRLFLRMVSNLDYNPRMSNNGLYPLPDIDFNLYCGNSLTGSDKLSDVSAYHENLLEIEELLKAYRTNQKECKTGEETHAQKETILERIYRCDRLHTNAQGTHYDEFSWLDGQAQLNWPIRFIDIMKSGGFDIIIGNPPYRENNKLGYSVSSYETSSCGNVYTCMMERGFSLLKKNGFLGMIVQLPIVCTDRMVAAQDILLGKDAWLYNFDDRPGKLFEDLEHIRATIVIATNGTGDVYTTRYNRWYSETRQSLFNSLTLTKHITIEDISSIPKIGDETSRSILQKICGRECINERVVRNGSLLYYHNAPLYFTRGTNFLPYFLNAAGVTISSSVKTIGLVDDTLRDVCSSLLNSSLFYMWYVYLSDCRHLNVREIGGFPLGYDTMSARNKEQLVDLCDKLMEDLKLNKIRKITNGARNGFMEFDEFKPKPSKPIMDEIDRVLGNHFGFTETELDYIINYDYKFRMADIGE